MKNEFNNAEEAFNHYYDYISANGVDFDNTRTIFNEGFTILNPMDNHIHTGFRNWNSRYAEREWAWYCSGNPDATEIASYAPIWKKHMDSKGLVRSNYGWQWERNDQLDKVVDTLKSNPNTRQAVISIYDGKEIHTYGNDTPCTYAVSFTIFRGRINMAVLMRSNDLWFGFCNDQYCFSKLQEKVADLVCLPVGSYYHHATNFHIYNDKLNKK